MKNKAYTITNELNECVKQHATKTERSESAVVRCALKAYFGDVKNE
jgi:hypothetical protein